MKLMYRLLIVLCFLILAGCATVKLSEQNTTIVMAKVFDKEMGISNITDVFTYEGNIYVYITIRWEELDKSAGRRTVVAKWFNGKKIISVSERNVWFRQTPYSLYFVTRGTNLGAGECHVEVYVSGVYVGSKSFTVVEKLENMQSTSEQSQSNQNSNLFAQRKALEETQQSGERDNKPETSIPAKLHSSSIGGAWLPKSNIKMQNLKRDVSKNVTELSKKYNYFPSSLINTYADAIMSSLNQNNGQALLIAHDGLRWTKFTFILDSNENLSKMNITRYAKNFGEVFENNKIDKGEWVKLIHQINTMGYATAVADGNFKYSYDFEKGGFLITSEKSYPRK